MDFDAISELAGQLVELVMSGDGMLRHPDWFVSSPVVSVLARDSFSPDNNLFRISAQSFCHPS